MKKHKNVLVWQIVWGILIAVILISGCYLYQLWSQYRAGQQAYDQIRKQLKTHFTLGQNAEPEPQADDGKNSGNDTANVNPAMWIQCEGTPIDYPVMQGTDNEYYLYHLPDGTPNGLGSIFMDYQNDPGLQDDNTILYGHHMQNGSMFASIDQYKDQSYFNQHPSLTLSTPEETYRVDLFAGYVGEGSKPLPIHFGTEGEYSSFIQEVKEKSTFESNMEVTVQDHILTMVTCDYDFSDARYILFGKIQKQ